MGKQPLLLLAPHQLVGSGRGLPGAPITLELAVEALGAFVHWQTRQEEPDDEEDEGEHGDDLIRHRMRNALTG